VLECVVNVSEGRDLAVLDALAAVCGRALLDRHVDADHHRSVFTLGSPDPGGTEAAVRRLVTLAVRDLDLRRHEGVHPRFGVVDVVPFVALDPTPADVAVAAARAFAAWLARTHGVPVFLYDAADPQERSLPDTRRDAFTTRAPDHGPRAPDPARGATAVGARPPLVAINFDLDRDDLDLARAVASAVRERDGGLAGVRALGLRLPSRAIAQVSLNVVDLASTDLGRVCAAVRAQVEQRGARVAGVELVGLVPAFVLERAGAALDWSGGSRGQSIEARVARAAGAASGATPGADRDSPA
jgi:glutamate formiminotransferase